MPASASIQPASPTTRRVVVLGSTGSVGVNALQVIEHLTRAGTHRFEVVGLAADTSARALSEQAARHPNAALAIRDASAADTLRAAHPRVDLHAGDLAAMHLIQQTDCDVVVGAIVGVAGLAPTLAALELGRDVCLANKEPLVAAGPLVMPLAQATSSRLTPIDSEHSAAAQCLQGIDPRRVGKQVRKLVLTASGGPFRDTPADELEAMPVERALKHPTWSMGPKITIDSATMMNKALEIIEAHYLFGLRPDQIDVVIHRESIIHAFVEFNDRSVLAQLGPPDMRTPIQYALVGPDRPVGCSDAIDFARLGQLNFQPPDPDRFPALRLAYRVMEQGGTAGAILNGANEAAVQAYLDRRITFGRITRLVADALDALPAEPLNTLDDALAADAAARAVVEHAITNDGPPAAIPSRRRTPSA